MAADWQIHGGAQLAVFLSTTDFGGESPDYSMGPVENDFVIDSDNDQPRWAEFDFGGVKMGFGRNHSPVHAWMSNHQPGSETGALNSGGEYDDGNDMMRFIVGDFKLSLIETNIGDNASAEDVDMPIPKIEAYYNLNYSHGRLAFLGGLNTYTLENESQDEGTKVTSWIFGLAGIHSFGPLYVSLDAFYTQNYANYGLPALIGQTGTGADFQNGLSADNTNTFGGLGAIGTNFDQAMNLKVGFDYRQDENPESVDHVDPTLGIYGQLPITLVNGFFIAPEIGYYTYMENAEVGEKSDLIYVGAKWQMDF